MFFHKDFAVRITLKFKEKQYVIADLHLTSKLSKKIKMLNDRQNEFENKTD